MAESWERAAKQEVSCSEIGSFNWFTNPSFASSEVDHLPRSAFFLFCLVANVAVIFAKPVLLPLLAQELNYRARPLWAKRDPGVGKACLHLRDVQRKVTKKQTCSSHKLEIIGKLEECFTAELPPLIHPSKLIPLQENERSSSSPCNEKIYIYIYAVRSKWNSKTSNVVAFCQVDSLPCRSKLSSRWRSSETLDGRNWQKSLG